MAAHTDEPDEGSETRTLHVRVEPSESFHERVLDRLTEIEEGRREPFEDRYGLSFTDYDDFEATFSAKNLELLEIIAECDPESIRETARLAERGTKEAHRNLTHLAELGVIEFEDNGRAKRPTVFYDEIELTVSLPRSNEENGENGETPPAES